MEISGTVMIPAAASSAAEETARAQAQQATLASMRMAHAGAEKRIKAIGSFLLIAAIWGAFGFLRSLDEVSKNPLHLADLVFVITYVIAGLLLRDLNPSGRALYTIAALARIGVNILMVSSVFQADTTYGGS